MTRSSDPADAERSHATSQQQQRSDSSSNASSSSGATQSERTAISAAGLKAFLQHDSKSPGMLLTNFGKNMKVVSLRIYKGSAFTAPGVEYKSIAVHTGMTTREVIARALQRFDLWDVNESDYGLMYVKPTSSGGAAKKALKSLLLRKSKSTASLILKDTDLPVFVAERFKSGTRRFELFKITRSQVTLRDLPQIPAPARGKKMSLPILQMPPQHRQSTEHLQQQTQGSGHLGETHRRQQSSPSILMSKQPHQQQEMHGSASEQALLYSHNAPILTADRRNSGNRERRRAPPPPPATAMDAVAEDVHEPRKMLDVDVSQIEAIQGRLFSKSGSQALLSPRSSPPTTDSASSSLPSELSGRSIHTDSPISSIHMSSTTSHEAERLQRTSESSGRDEVTAFVPPHLPQRVLEEKQTHADLRNTTYQRHRPFSCVASATETKPSTHNTASAATVTETMRARNHEYNHVQSKRHSIGVFGMPQNFLMQESDRALHQHQQTTQHQHQQRQGAPLPVQKRASLPVQLGSHAAPVHLRRRHRTSAAMRQNRLSYNPGFNVAKRQSMLIDTNLPPSFAPRVTNLDAPVGPQLQNIAPSTTVAVPAHAGLSATMEDFHKQEAELHREWSEVLEDSASIASSIGIDAERTGRASHRQDSASDPGNTPSVRSATPSDTASIEDGPSIISLDQSPRASGYRPPAQACTHSGLPPIAKHEDEGESKAADYHDTGDEVEAAVAVADERQGLVGPTSVLPSNVPQSYSPAPARTPAPQPETPPSPLSSLASSCTSLREPHPSTTPPPPPTGREPSFFEHVSPRNSLVCGGSRQTSPDASTAGEVVDVSEPERAECTFFSEPTLGLRQPSQMALVASAAKEEPVSTPVVSDRDSMVDVVDGSSLLKGSETGSALNDSGIATSCETDITLEDSRRSKLEAASFSVVVFEEEGPPDVVAESDDAPLPPLPACSLPDSSASSTSSLFDDNEDDDDDDDDKQTPAPSSTQIGVGLVDVPCKSDATALITEYMAVTKQEDQFHDGEIRTQHVSLDNGEAREKAVVEGNDNAGSFVSMTASARLCTLYPSDTRTRSSSSCSSSSSNSNLTNSVDDAAPHASNSSNSDNSHSLDLGRLSPENSLGEHASALSMAAVDATLKSPDCMVDKEAVPDQATEVDRVCLLTPPKQPGAIISTIPLPKPRRKQATTSSNLDSQPSTSSSVVPTTNDTSAMASSSSTALTVVASSLKGNPISTANKVARNSRSPVPAPPPAEKKTALVDNAAVAMRRKAIRQRQLLLQAQRRQREAALQQPNEEGGDGNQGTEIASEKPRGRSEFVKHAPPVTPRKSRLDVAPSTATSRATSVVAAQQARPTCQDSDSGLQQHREMDRVSHRLRSTPTAAERGLRETGINLRALDRERKRRVHRTVAAQRPTQDAGLKTTGISLLKLDSKRRLAQFERARANAPNRAGRRPERLSFADRLSLFQG